MTVKHELDEDSVLIVSQLRIAASIAMPAHDGWTRLNTSTREMLVEAADEIKMLREDGVREPDYYEKLTQAWTQDPLAIGPLIIAETGDSFDIGDGWHRAAISIVEGIRAVPAILGTRR